LPEDERFVEPFRLQIEWLKIFGRVDPQIPNSSAIFQKNSIPIIYTLDSNKLLCACWSDEGQKSFTLFVSFKSITTGSIGQHAEDSLN